MKNINPKMAITENTCVKKAILAYRNHDFLYCGSVSLDALKKEIVEMIEATKASNTKKCPIWPGNKCSPSNFMLVYGLDWVTVFSSCFLSSLYFEGHLSKILSHSKMSLFIFPFKTILSLFSNSDGFGL